ncbi:MAG TPA: hypothetical protein VHQ03_08820, partial [Candidatus Dormibacteraeota bacterium]|nr:hypothetical protein [Candidatus Dormibacteraeota bacterium]
MRAAHIEVPVAVSKEVRTADAERAPSEDTSKPFVWRVLSIGLVVRLILAPFTAWSFDVAPWFHASLLGYYGLHLYSRPGFSYPPVWGYCLQILGQLVRLAGFGPGFFGGQNRQLTLATAVTGDYSDIVTSPVFNLLFKSVLFGFDVVTGLLIYRTVLLLGGDPRRARLSFAAWFLNPFVIYESAVHGASDVLVGLSVLATLLLVLSGRTFWGGAAWMIGVLTKVSPLAIGLQLIIAIAMAKTGPETSFRGRLTLLRDVGVGAAVAAILILSPELLSGSVPAMVHNVVTRAQSGMVIGGFSFTAIRYLKVWSWLLLWGYQNSPQLLRLSSIAQAATTLLWGAWTYVLVRRTPAFALLTGSFGTLASIALLSPVSNPQYVLWWLPILTVLVFVTGRGYWQLALLGVAPVVFSLAILGPAAPLAPLATYT